MRRHWMDNLRWVTVVLVLIYHVFYFYNNKGVVGGIGGFDPDPTHQIQDVVMYILYPWFMMLLFLVAGISSKYALEKKRDKEFMRSRTLKLLVPSTIGLFVFQWICGYFNTAVTTVVKGVSPLGNVPAFAKYVIYALSGTGPLWFIQDLWLFSLILVLIRKVDRKDRVWTLGGKVGYAGIFLLGLLVFLGHQTLIADPRPDTADGLVNLYKPIAYFIPFMLGYWVFSHDGIQEKVARLHIPLLVAALASGIAFTIVFWGKDNTTPECLGGWLNNLYAYLMILAMLGCFKTWFDRTGKFASYMSRSSFGIYIVHYTIIASLGYTLKMYTALPTFVIYVILLLSVLLLSPALYELLRRIPLVRWCVLGIKKNK